MNRTASSSEPQMMATIACNRIFRSPAGRVNVSLIDVEIQVHITNVDYHVMRPGETAEHRDYGPGEAPPDLWVTVVHATVFATAPWPAIEDAATEAMIINIVGAAVQNSTLGAGGAAAFLAAIREAVQ
jgi:hypothetical protein